VPPPSEGTLIQFLEPIARELKSTIRVPKALQSRLIYCSFTPQPAAQKLQGISKALGLRISRGKAENELILERTPSRDATRLDLMKRFWRDYANRVSPYVGGDAKTITRRRLLMDHASIQEEAAGLRKTSEWRERALTAEALMLLEEPAALVVFRKLQSLTPDEIVSPYGTLPRGGRWLEVSSQELEAAGFEPSDRMRPLFQQPGAMVVVRPYWRRHELSWHLVLVLPNAHATLGDFMISEVAANNSVALPKMAAPASQTQLSLAPNRPKESMLTLGSLAGALPRAGLSFAAWITCEPVYFRRSNGTLQELSQEPRSSPKIRIGDVGQGWVGVQVTPEPPTIVPGIDWKRVLPMLDAFDSGRLKLKDLEDRLSSCTAKEITALADISYEYPSLSHSYGAFTEGAGLLRAFFRAKEKLLGGSPVKVRDIPTAARRDIEAYLRCARFAQDFPEWFHPASTVDIGEMLLTGSVTKEGGNDIVHVSLRSQFGVGVNEYRLILPSEA
jgi:hypothetical protein